MGVMFRSAKILTAVQSASLTEGQITAATGIRQPGKVLLRLLVAGMVTARRDSSDELVWTVVR